MAKKKVIRFIQAALLAATVVAAIPACTDDHFDVRDNAGEEGGNATQTIWEQINDNKHLKKFAALIEKTPYFKDETHQIYKIDGTPYTFKDVLNGTQILTVFAPTDDAISDAEYKELLGKCDTNPYDVYLRMAGNHITKNRYTATGTGEEKIVLVNGKKAYFSRDRKIVSGSPLTSENRDQFISLLELDGQKLYNLPATNGTLHLIAKQMPFHYNIYQYIKQHAEQFDSLRTWLLSHDTIYFEPGLSVEGGSDENGNPFYVDSVYLRSNTLYAYSHGSTTGIEWLMDIKGFSGNIEQEDSVWAMVLPTDKAWRKAWEDYDAYYNYASEYPNKYEQDTNPESVEKFNVNADSIKQLAKRMDIASVLLFNIRQQPRTPEHPNYWTAETFNATPMYKVFNTRLDTFTIARQMTVQLDSVTTKTWMETDPAADVKGMLLANSTPVEVSNGLVYPVNEWNFFKPFKSKDVEIKISGYSLFQDEESLSNSEYHSFPNDVSPLVTDSLLGRVSEDYFYSFYGTGNTSAKFKVRDNKLNHEIMSGVKYRVGFVMVPDFYYYSTDEVLENQKKKHKFTVSISHLQQDNKGNIKEGIDFGNKTFEYQGERVDTIWLKDNMGEYVTYSSPFSYKNLTRSYPVLTLTASASPLEIKSQGYSNEMFNIDRIIFQAVEE